MRAKASEARLHIDFVKIGQYGPASRTFTTLPNSLSSSNLLYPKEDRATSQLLFVCKACHATQIFDSACTYRNQLGSTVTETAGVTTDVANDPTVRDDSFLVPCFCTMCGEEVRCGGCEESAMEEFDVSDLSSQEGTRETQSDHFLTKRSIEAFTD